MTEGHADIHGRVLDHLLDGVMVVERGGAITVFNPAAARILGVSAGEVAGSTFTELFIAREGFEELSEFILDAVAGAGAGRRQVVALHAGDAARTLSVATSYIRAGGDGAGETMALIAVFSDITELRELRETELRMAKAVATQHAELQTAYRQIEERNETLAATLKKVQVARVAATVLVIGVFLGAGAYVWQPLDFFGGSSGPSVVSRADAGVAEGFRLIVVEPRPLRETISLVGELAPWRTVSVTSPIESRVLAVHFQYGQEVEEGDLLVELDTAEVVRQHRQAQVAYIDALEAFETVSDWENGPEMAGARRAFVRARMALESQETRLQRTAFLLEQGLIPASQHEEAERQYQRQLLDVEAARQDLDAARARGGEEALDKAVLELSGAEDERRELAESLGTGRVHAPVSGAVLAPSRSGANVLVAGRSVEEGEALLRIGDFSRMTAIAAVDEVDVVRIAVGQAVSVTGNAFPDLRMRGTVTHVSSQPLPKTRGATRFEVEVTLDPLEADQRERLRAGMSSTLQVAVYSNDAALMVPIEAVDRSGPSHLVRLVNRETREVQEHAVQVGTTTLDSVEITAGLQPGDEIVVRAE